MIQPLFQKDYIKIYNILQEGRRKWKMKKHIQKKMYIKKYNNEKSILNKIKELISDFDG